MVRRGLEAVVDADGAGARGAALQQLQASKSCAVRGARHSTITSMSLVQPLPSDRKKAGKAPVSHRGQPSVRGDTSHRVAAATGPAAAAAPSPEKKKKKKKKSMDGDEKHKHKPKASAVTSLALDAAASVPEEGADVQSLLAEALCGTPRGAAYAAASGSPPTPPSAAAAASSGASAEGVAADSMVQKDDAPTSSSEDESTATSDTEGPSSEEEVLPPRSSMWAPLDTSTRLLAVDVTDESAPAPAAAAPAPAPL